MKKKIYQPPCVKVRSVRTQQIICGSIRTERLTERNLDWGEPGIDPGSGTGSGTGSGSGSGSGSSIESLTESIFTSW